MAYNYCPNHGYTWQNYIGAFHGAFVFDMFVSPLSCLQVLFVGNLSMLLSVSLMVFLQ